MTGEQLIEFALLLHHELERGEREKAVATCRDILLGLEPAAEVLVRQCGIVEDDGVSCGELAAAEILPPQLGSPYVCRDHLHQARALGWPVRILLDE